MRRVPWVVAVLGGVVAAASIAGAVPAEAGSKPARAATTGPTAVGSSATTGPSGATVVQSGHATTGLSGTAGASSTHNDTAARARSYWTRARMAAAEPRDRFLTPSPARFTRRPGLSSYLQQFSPSRVVQLPADTGSTWTRGGLVARTTGKVFFTLGGVDYVCSGSAVTSPDRSTVLTAGHCVYDPQAGKGASRWVFVPGYDRGRTPYGMFAATRLATAAGWAEDEDFDVDLAFANVGRNEAGRLLTDAVGGQKIAFGTPRGRPAVALGYPAEAPWTGQSLIGCAGGLRQDTTPQPTTDQGMACTMTGGSSGGPWLSDFDPLTGRGTLTSVTSFGYTGQPGVLWGPYLGEVAGALYTKVASSTSA